MKYKLDEASVVLSHEFRDIPDEKVEEAITALKSVVIGQGGYIEWEIELLSNALAPFRVHNFERSEYKRKKLQSEMENKHLSFVRLLYLGYEFNEAFRILSYKFRAIPDSLLPQLLKQVRDNIIFGGCGRVVWEEGAFSEFLKRFCKEYSVNPLVQSRTKPQISELESKMRDFFQDWTEESWRRKTIECRRSWSYELERLEFISYFNSLFYKVDGRLERNEFNLIVKELNTVGIKHNSTV